MMVTWVIHLLDVICSPKCNKNLSTLANHHLVEGTLSAESLGRVQLAHASLGILEDLQIVDQNA